MTGLGRKSVLAIRGVITDLEQKEIVFFYITIEETVKQREKKDQALS